MKKQHHAICFLVLFTLWVVCGGFSRSVCEIVACHDYVNSRPGGVNSDQFVAMGIKKNMNANQVEVLLAGADFRTGLMKMQYEGGQEEKGFSQMFEFEYGPKWSPFLIGKPRSVCKELIEVSYDENGLARSVARQSVSGLLVFAATKHVNLE